MNYIYRYDIAAIIILFSIIVRFYRQRTILSKFVHCYAFLMILSFCSSLIDLISSIVLKNPMNYSVGFLYFLKIIYQLIYHSLPFSFYLCMFFKLSDNRKYNAKRIVLFGIPYYIIILLIATTGYTKLILYFDESNCYQHGILYVFLYIEATFYLFLALYCVNKNKTAYSREQRAMVYFYLAACLLTVALQLIFTNLRLMGFVLSIALFLGCFTLDNPTDFIDSELNILNKTALIVNLRRYFEKQEPLYFIGIKIEGLDSVFTYLGNENRSELIKNINSYLQTIFLKKQLYRISENIFVGILNSDHEARKEQLLNLQRRFAQPFKCGNTEILVTMLCNLVNYPEDGTSMEEIIDYLENSYADLSTAEHNNLHQVDKSILEKRNRENHIAELMEKALLEDGFEVVYQPIFSARMNKFTAAEALIRLTNSDIGDLSPDEFIPIAEQNGMIIPIGIYVIKSVCKFLEKYKIWNYGLEHININLSANQCMQERLCEQIYEIMDSYNINYQYIHFEITEFTTIFTSNEMLLFNMKEFNKNNINFSLDAYGRNNSNIVNLIKFPFRAIKIDKTLIWAAMKDENARIILQETILMIKSLKMKVVVEGIENQEQAFLMLNMGSDYLQGFHYSYPLNKEDFAKFIKNLYY